jgi:hypothetical protein
LIGDDQVARKKLSRYVESRLPAKIRKVKADHPELNDKQALGMAIGILKEREKKVGFSSDVKRRERRGKKKAW